MTRLRQFFASLLITAIHAPETGRLSSLIFHMS